MLMSDAGGSANMLAASTSHSVNAPPACCLTNSDCLRDATGPRAIPLLVSLTSLPFPAPAEPYGPGLAEFNGTQPTGANGTWSLYVNDAAAGDTGFIGTWNITIFTDAGGLPGAGNPVPCGKPDFDGDGRADTVVYRRGSWELVRGGIGCGVFQPRH